MPTAATCHPDRRVEGFGLCGPCYRKLPKVKSRHNEEKRRWKERHPEYERPYRGPATCHPERERWTQQGECRQCHHRRYYEANKRAIIERTKQWAKDNPERRARIRRKYHYGISPGRFQTLLKAQDGLCAICRLSPATHLDHDHSTGKVRGILCQPCNSAIGLLREDNKILSQAIDYLDFWRDQ